jgi:hypothetical protein
VFNILHLQIGWLVLYIIIANQLLALHEHIKIVSNRIFHSLFYYIY